MFCVLKNPTKPSSHALAKNHPQHPLKTQSKDQTAAQPKRRPNKRKHDSLQPSEGEPKKGKVEDEKQQIFAKTKREKPSENWKAFIANSGSSARANKERPRPKWQASQSNQATLSAELTPAVGLDCEMVGGGDKGKDSLLARVSIVNQHGQCLYDTFVKPIADTAITDYRTKYSGVRPANLKTAISFEEAQRRVADLIKGRIVVGHDLSNDFRVLFLSHPRSKVRDTAKYLPLRQFADGKATSRPSLKTLAEKILDIKIQQGEHNSIIDAKAAMGLYMMHHKQWELSIRKKKAEIHGRGKIHK